MNPLRILVAASTVAALVVPASAPSEARSGADGAYPFKNTVYKGKGEVASVGYKAKVKIKIGKDIKKVKKLVVKIRCPEGKRKFVRKNLPIDEKGYIYWDQRWRDDFFGQFVTRHKVDQVSVIGDQSKVCSTYVVNMVAKDR